MDKIWLWSVNWMAVIYRYYFLYFDGNIVIVREDIFVLRKDTQVLGDNEVS